VTFKSALLSLVRTVGGEQGRWDHGERGSSRDDGHTCEPQAMPGRFFEVGEARRRRRLILWACDERAKNITGTAIPIEAQIS